MDFKKDLSNVAAEVAKIMEAELSAKQKKIAKMSEPHHKIDAGDLAKLRAGHKPVKEETVTESDLPKSNSKDQKTVTVKHKTSGKELKVADTPSVREKYKKMDYHPMSEGIEDKIEAARKKAKAAGKPIKEPKKEVSAKRKVEGPRYGGGKQKDEVEESINLPFTSMLEAYDANGLSAFVKQQVQEQISEEVDNDTYTKELETNKKKNAGELRNDKGVAAGATQSVEVQKEEVVAEGDAYDKDRYAVKNGKATKDNPSHKGSPNYKDQAHHVWANSAEEALQKKMKEEVEQVDERQMTEPEMKHREKIVKSMKKNLAGFKERYGDRAKSVMYATATKQAMKD